ncbi:MAG: mechanosensitive ion channel [Ruminococcaceae bacterium]|nr:mechanosensitive ion channel [Oscillospiraceae bacterium]
MDFKTMWNFLFELGTSLGLKLIGAVIVLFVGVKLIKFIKKFIKKSPKLNKLDDGVRSFLASFSVIALYIVLFITVAMMLGIPTTSFITALASCGVAIGLAMQGSLSNFAGGLMILLFKPFKAGDFIDAGGTLGTVTDITVVYTVLTTADNKVITIPNGTLTNSIIINYSKKDTRRVDLTFDASYSSDIDKVKEIIEGVVNSHELVLSDPEPMIKLSAHNASALTYTVRVWCKASDYWTVHFDLLETVKKEFDKNNIEIPFPQMDVHVKN